MKQINFIKHIPLYFSISGVALAIGIFSLVVWKVRPAIDFTGGSLVEVELQAQEGNVVNEGTIRSTLSDKAIEINSIQPAGGNRWLIRTKMAEGIDKNVQSALAEKFSVVNITRFESIGPALGKELLTKTFFGITLSSLGILLYVAYRFGGGKYGVCAVLAMIHDSLVVLGAFSLLGHFYGAEVDALFVTALLTILSFSVHDTIVVYDRIRENLRKFPQEKFEPLANRSVNETLRRSINNSLTIIVMLVILTWLGGATVRFFSLALLIGTITGTYSSPFVAVPLLVVWNKRANKKKKS
ncbi:protein translocase subunit SecF [Candidatus Collierbacteria bacterium]|nr:protein translocase subunit SecF [Candidatus Collierbacteria bacterium]